MANKYLYEIALGKVPLVGPINAKSLISYCGGAEAVFTEKKSKLLRIPGIGEKIAESILEADPLVIAESEIEFLEKNDVEVLSYNDQAYPKRLLQQEDAPVLLFKKGNANLNEARHVAIVGTRKPSEYGKIQVEQIVKGLSIYQPTIVSGLAYGIDTAAHKAALQAKLPTIGVLGHGLDRLYPAQNKRLASEMIKNGALLTEFPSGTNPDAVNFPMRNRIIAAFSDVIIVVESARKGGSIITAHFANAYNKDVFAVPGKLTDERSLGCNMLIKQHKAALIESAADVAYIMRWEDEGLAPKSIQSTLFLELDETESGIHQYLVEHGQSTLDQMHHDLTMPLSLLSTKLLELEFKGAVRSLPGKTYMTV